MKTLSIYIKAKENLYLSNGEFTPLLQSIYDNVGSKIWTYQYSEELCPNDNETVLELDDEVYRNDVINFLKSIPEIIEIKEDIYYIQEIEDEFEDLICEQLTNEQFWKYVSGWKDEEEIVDEMLNWDFEIKLEEIETLRKYKNASTKSKN